MLEALIALSPDAMIAVDASGVIRATNEMAAQLFGWTSATLTGQPLEVLIAPNFREAHRAHIERQFAAGGARSMGSGLRITALACDGREIPVDVALRTVDLPDGRLTITSIRDVTAERNLEAALRERERCLQNAVDLAHLGTWALDLRTDQRRYSPELLALLGLEADGAEAFAFFEHVHPDDRSAVAAATGQAIATGEGYRLLLRVRCGDGAWRCFETQTSVALDAEGKAERIIGVVTDVTERETQAERARFTDKLTSLGLMAGGIVHEFGSPMTALVVSLEMADEHLHALVAPESSAETSEVAICGLGESLHEAQMAAGHARATLRDMTAFHRMQETSDRVDLRHVVDVAVRLARFRLDPSTRIQVEAVPVPLFRGAEASLIQVVLNLLVNAAQASTQADGVSTVRLTVAHEGSFVEIAVADDGPGIPPEVRSRLFTPYFTTKPTGEGTGLGLYICDRIVTEHGGTIVVDGAGGRGTVVRVRLPLVRATARRPQG